MARDPALLQDEVAGDGRGVHIEHARDAAVAGQGGVLRRRVRHLHLAESGAGDGAVANFRPAILAPDSQLPVIAVLPMEVRGMAGASKIPPTIGGEPSSASRIEIPGNSPTVILGCEIAGASKTPPRTGPSSRTISPIPAMERSPKSMSQQAARSHPGIGEKADTRGRIRVEEGVVDLREVAAVHVHDAGSDMAAEPGRSGGGRLFLPRLACDGGQAWKRQAARSEREASGHVVPRFGTGSQEHGSSMPGR